MTFVARAARVRQSSNILSVAMTVVSKNGTIQICPNSLRWGELYGSSKNVGYKNSQSLASSTLVFRGDRFPCYFLYCARWFQYATSTFELIYTTIKLLLRNTSWSTVYHTVQEGLYNPHSDDSVKRY